MLHAPEVKDPPWPTAGKVPLHPHFAVEHARVKLELLIQIKEGWGRADVSVQQKAA